MVDNCEVITKSAAETQEFGAKIAGDLIRSLPADKQGTVIALFGDLSSGKTTFMQGFAQDLGIKQRILSPTFVLMRQYRVIPSTSEGSSPCHPEHQRGIFPKKILRSTQNDKWRMLFHIDLYRINKQEETESLGLPDLWSDPKNIIAIEWPEKIVNILPKNRIEIYFEYIEDTKRKILVSS